MRKEKLLLTFAVLVGVTFLAGPALAVPLGYETYQEWTFDDDDNPADPEIDLNPNPAKAIISGPGAAPPEWLLTLDDRTGVWTGESVFQIALDVPNYIIDNPYKEIYLEIGFHGDLDGFPSVYPQGGGGILVQKRETIEVVDPATGWQKLTGWYRIEPNPHKEVIFNYFSSGAAVDYVKVFTVCVPEPLTICLLGLGGLMLRRRRFA